MIHAPPPQKPPTFWESLGLGPPPPLPAYNVQRWGGGEGEGSEEQYRRQYSSSSVCRSGFSIAKGAQIERYWSDINSDREGYLSPDTDITDTAPLGKDTFGPTLINN